MTPLDVVETRWQGDSANAPAMTVPYFGVVNLQVDLDDMPDIWGALLCQPETDADITFGSRPHVMESGVFVVGLFARTNTGPRVLDAATRELKRAFHGWEAAGVRIVRVDGPLEINPEAEGNWWRLAFTMPYEFIYRRDNTGPGFADQQGLPVQVGTGVAGGAGGGGAA